MTVLRLGLAVIGLWAGNAVFADDVDELVRSYMQKRQIPGLSLAVIKDGKMIKAQGYGLANLETQAPASPETVYKIGSISKPLLAAAILLLADEGKLGLDDKLPPYLPGTPEGWKEITIRHLLSHTSGLIENPPGFSPFRVKPDQEVIASLYPEPLLFPPGEKWSYSNAGYFVLGEIILRVTGKPWSSFMTERVFAPAGLAQTRTTTATGIVRNRASGYHYSWPDERWENAPNWIAVRPSGAFLSTVLDLAKWDMILDSDAVLNSSIRERMSTATKLANGEPARCGLGWYVDSWNGHRRVHHSGGLPGFRADYERFIDDKLTVIVLFNEDSVADPEKIALKVAGCYVPALAPPADKPLTDTEPQLTEKIRSAIAGLAAGRVDQDLYTPAVIAALDPLVRATVAAQLRHRAARSMELVGRNDNGEYKVHRYRLVYADTDFLMWIALDRSGKIAGFGAEFD
jgi:D-alanyl-D-alanine carboxypeptidase